MGCGAGQAPLYVTGHSLGAGLAGISMMSLFHDGWSIAESYNFGMPRTGDEDFAKTFDKLFGDRFFRVTHHMDPIPHTPPNELLVDWHYVHVSPEIFYNGELARGYVECQEPRNMSCSEQYMKLPGNIQHSIQDHLDYMDIPISKCPSADGTYNNITFENSRSLTFTMDTHSIGDEDDWGHLEPYDDRIAFIAERHGSTKPAESFKKGLHASQVVAPRVQDSNTVFPEKLNFWVLGTLAFQLKDVWFTCSNMRLAQGHTGSSEGWNNWWIGGESCPKSGKHTGDPLVCDCNWGRQVQFATMPGSSYRFKVSEVRSKLSVQV